MPEKETLVGQFFDVLTGETIVRELTEEEIAELPPQSLVSNVVAS